MERYEHFIKSNKNTPTHRQGESTRNMSVQLYNELTHRLTTLPMPVIEEDNVLKGRYTERQFEEAVHLRDFTGCLLVHYACRYNASESVIQLLLDSYNGNNSIYKKNVMGWLPIHAACEQGFLHLDIFRLLISRDVEKKTLLVKDQRGRVPL